MSANKASDMLVELFPDKFSSIEANELLDLIIQAAREEIEKDIISYMSDHELAKHRGGR